MCFGLLLKRFITLKIVIWKKLTVRNGPSDEGCKGPNIRIFLRNGAHLRSPVARSLRTCYFRLLPGSWFNTQCCVDFFPPCFFLFPLSSHHCMVRP